MRRHRGQSRKLPAGSGRSPREETEEDEEMTAEHLQNRRKPSPRDERAHCTPSGRTSDGTGRNREERLSGS